LDLIGVKKKRFRQPWEAIVNIVLIEGFNLNAMDDNGLSDPYVKFRLGSEKYRSKVIRHTLNPKYYESFKLHIYNTNKMTLNITVYDYDSVADEFMGK
jgi:Ca2+-dependent lipid-binding protein